MSTKSSANARAVPVDIALIVFGEDSDNKHRASQFGSNHAVRARRRAETLEMRVLPVSDEQRSVAAKLPKGKLTASGGTVVPFVSRSLYQKVLAIAGPQSNTGPTATGTASSGPSKGNGDGQWHFKKGGECLAVENDTDGWFECIVENVDGDVLTLSWEGWPDLPHFFRKVTQVAVRHPNQTRAW